VLGNLVGGLLLTGLPLYLTYGRPASLRGGQPTASASGTEPTAERELVAEPA
jgi:hypothetical protein